MANALILLLALSLPLLGADYKDPTQGMPGFSRPLRVGGDEPKKTPPAPVPEPAEPVDPPPPAPMSISTPAAVPVPVSFSTIAVASMTVWDALGFESAAYLSDLVRINTVNPPGGERAACDYLAGVLTRAGIPFEIFESSPGRANIIARLKGDGTKRPILLLSHLDTVGVERERWSFDPFTGERRDGYIFGRGSIDDKSMTAAFLAALLHVKRSTWTLKRDIVFAATADEESGGRLGVRWLLERHPKALDAEFAISEGGTTLLREGAVRLLAIQVLEKSYFDVRLLARGVGGHASIPHPRNAIKLLSAALGRILEWRPEVRLNPVTHSYLEGVRGVEREPMVGAIEDVLSEEPERVARGRKTFEGNPYYLAMLTDTVVPTMIHGGVRENVVASEAWANLNIRLLPETDPVRFLEELAHVIDEPAIEISVIERPAGPSPAAMPLDSSFFAAFANTAARLAPGAVVVPSMSAGTTDAEHLRRRGVLVYGFGLPMRYEDEVRIHGHDERMLVEGLSLGTRFIVELLKEIAR